VELRRALLLFAIVLGVAAIVAAVANPPAREDDRTTTAPSAADARPANGGRPPARIRLDGHEAPRTRRLEIGRAVTLTVPVDEAGLVELSGLGLTDSAEPRDPAVFDLFPTARGRYEVLFTPAGGVRARALGALVSQPEK